MRQSRDYSRPHVKFFFFLSLLLIFAAFVTTACVSSFNPRTPANDEKSIPGPNTSPEAKDPLAKGKDIDVKSNNKNSAKEFKAQANAKNGGLKAQARGDQRNDKKQAKPTKERNRKAITTMKEQKSKKNLAAGRKGKSKYKKPTDRPRHVFEVSKNKQPRKVKDYQKNKGAKKWDRKKGRNNLTLAKANLGSRHIAQENVCNSVQYEAFPDLNFALASGERLSSISFSVDNAYIAVTENPVIGTQFFYYKNLGDDVIDDIYDYFDDVGAKPKLVELDPYDRYQHVAIYGANGFSTTFSTASEVYDVLSDVNQLGYYIQDVALGTEADSIVVIYDFEEFPAADDYSGFTGYNIPNELYDELEFLYDQREQVQNVAIGPVYPGFFENSWIVTYGEFGESISYYGIPNDVKDELFSVSDFGSTVENVAFDVEGGTLVHSVDAKYELQSLVQFQNATPYTVQPPELKSRKVTGGMELSFPSQINTQYQILKANSLSSQNWTADGAPIIGNGSIRTVVKTTTGTQGFFKLGDTVYTPACDRLTYRFYLEPDQETAPDQLTCFFNGSNYQPYNEREGFPIGRKTFGFSQRSSCQTAIDNATPEAVCNWNGSGYSPYDLVNKPADGQDQPNIGEQGFGFANFNDCLTATANAQSGAVCNWNGSNYSPYYAKRNIAIGKPDFGYNTLSSCVDAVNMASNKLLCNWNGSGYTPYYVDGTGQVGKEDHGFGSYANCNGAVSNSSTYFACNWNGTYTQPYTLANNVAVFEEGRSFGIREDCFTTTFESEINQTICHPYEGDYSHFTATAPKVAVPGSSYFFFQQCVDAQ